jgi:hypothetical protein
MKLIPYYLSGVFIAIFLGILLWINVVQWHIPQTLLLPNDVKLPSMVLSGSPGSRVELTVELDPSLRADSMVYEIATGTPNIGTPNIKDHALAVYLDSWSGRHDIPLIQPLIICNMSMTIWGYIPTDAIVVNEIIIATANHHYRFNVKREPYNKDPGLRTCQYLEPEIQFYGGMNETVRNIFTWLFFGCIYMTSIIMPLALVVVWHSGQSPTQTPDANNDSTYKQSYQKLHDISLK